MCRRQLSTISYIDFSLCIFSNNIFHSIFSQSEWLGIQWVWMKFAWWKVFAVISTSLFCQLYALVFFFALSQVMWPHPEYFLPDDYHEVRISQTFLCCCLSLPWIIKIFIYIFNNSKELPHKRIVRNVRKLLTSNPSRVELENLLTALPRGSRPKRNYDDDDDWGWALLLWFWYKTIWWWIELSCCWLFRAFLYFTIQQ